MNEHTSTTTYKELLENAAKLAANRELRKKIEEEVSSGLLPGHSFHIDEFGWGHFWGPIIVSKPIQERK